MRARPPPLGSAEGKDPLVRLEKLHINCTDALADGEGVTGRERTAGVADDG